MAARDPKKFTMIRDGQDHPKWKGGVSYLYRDVKKRREYMRNYMREYNRRRRLQAASSGASTAA